MNPWDTRYSDEGFYYGTEPNDFLKEHAGAIPAGGRVLCLAEGEGRNAVFLAQQEAHVTAVDGSEVGLSKLRRLAESKGVEVRTVHADLNDFRIEPRSWDAIVSIWCHLPEPLRRKVHQASVQGLKKGGVFLLESYHPRQLGFKTGGPPTADLMMTRDSLTRELDGLDFEVLREIDREVREGRGHHGMSAVVQVLGRRLD